MEAKPKNEKTKLSSLDANVKKNGNYQGKISFIIRLVNTIINLCISEAPDVKNKNFVIEKFNELFQCGDENMIKSLSEFIYNHLLKSLKDINQEKNRHVLLVLVNLSKFIKNKITFDQLFNILAEDLNNVIDVVRNNGSKTASIEILNKFYDYTNDHLNKLTEMKMAVNPKKCKEENEKIRKNICIEHEKQIESLKDKLQENEKELFRLNEIKIRESLDKGAYKESNELLFNKIKEMEKRMEDMKDQFKTEMSERDKKMKEQFKTEMSEMKRQYETKLAETEKKVNLQMDAMKKKNGQKELENKRKIQELFNLLRDNIRLIRRLENITQQLVVHYNELFEMNVELNKDLNHLAPYFEYIAEANPFNYQFFK